MIGILFHRAQMGEKEILISCSYQFWHSDVKRFKAGSLELGPSQCFLCFAPSRISALLGVEVVNYDRPYSHRSFHPLFHSGSMASRSAVKVGPSGEKQSSVEGSLTLVEPQVGVNSKRKKDAANCVKVNVKPST